MTLLKEHDLGTPAKPGIATIEVLIDGISIAVPAGTKRAIEHRLAKVL